MKIPNWICCYEHKHSCRTQSCCWSGSFLLIPSIILVIFTSDCEQSTRCDDPGVYHLNMIGRYLCTSIIILNILLYIWMICYVKFKKIDASKARVCSVIVTQPQMIERRVANTRTPIFSVLTNRPSITSSYRSSYRRSITITRPQDIAPRNSHPDIYNINEREPDVHISTTQIAPFNTNNNNNISALGIPYTTSIGYPVSEFIV